jgi:hypothetical protein
MSEKTLHNPHLKENPFKVPAGYFQQVEARWADLSKKENDRVFVQGNTADTERLDNRKGRRFIRLLRPQLQLAAAFVLLFGIGYLLLTITGRNETQQMQTEELSVLSEWSVLGLDHRDISNLILEDLFEENRLTTVIDPDLEDLIDYMDYPGFDPVNLALNTDIE